VESTKISAVDPHAPRNSSLANSLQNPCQQPQLVTWENLLGPAKSLCQ